MKKTRGKIVVILGPTATGKTKLAVKLAAQFNGEIISADSRQVYRGMDVGTGKDLDDYKIKLKGKRKKEKDKNLRQRRMRLWRKNLRIKYHLIDVVSPKTEFNVAKYQKLAYRAIDDVLARGKTPFLVGGTGLYLDAVVKGYPFHNFQFSMVRSRSPQVFNFQKIRKKLNKLTLDQLLSRLKKIDPATYEVIDQKNRRRVQRALEIYYETGRPKSAQIEPVKPPYDFLLLGVTFSREVLKGRIRKRLVQRLEKEAMVAEVKKLHQQGVSWKRLDDFGLEYRWLGRYLKGEINYEKMKDELARAINNFAKRQMTWFKRNQEIIWGNSFNETKKLIREFLGLV